MMLLWRNLKIIIFCVLLSTLIGGTAAFWRSRGRRRRSVGLQLRNRLLKYDCFSPDATALNSEIQKVKYFF